MPIEPTVAEILDDLATRVDARIPDDPTRDDSLFAQVRLLLDQAGEHAHVGEDIPEAARARVLKKAVLGGLRPVTSYQRVFNTRILDAVEILSALLRSRIAENLDFEPRLNRMNASIATIEIAVDQAARGVRDLDDRLDATAGSDDHEPRDDLADRLTAIETELAELRAMIVTDPAPTNTVDPELYTALEDTFRGTREAIRELVEPYVADIEATGSRAPVIDIGCGRGEWLEVLADHDITSYGVDLNPLTVEACADLGLDVRLGDAVVHLGSLEEASVAAVTGFHIAEHLPFATLVELLGTARRALVPGGSLILETPNCTNLAVGASSFHLDPTHIRPLHPQLLEFLCRRQGFDEVEVRFLHPRSADIVAEAANGSTHTLPDALLEELNWALFGPMDYAVIATKAP